VKLSNMPRSGRAAVLMRVAGLGLVAAVFVGPVAANADSGSGSAGLFESVTGVVGGLFGGGSSPAATDNGYASNSDTSTAATAKSAGSAATPAAGSATGTGSGSAAAGNSGSAAAGNSGSTTANSVGNSGLGSGNQVSGSVQAPITIDCNAVGILGYGQADCPQASSDSPPPPATTIPGTTRKAPPTTVAATTAALPLTGSDSEPIGIAGGSLLLLGGGLLVISRPRRKSRHAAR
jgi:LPXTG-motif cell wall-anchored protein